MLPVRLLLAAVGPALVSSLVLPQENSRAPYREHPTLFHKEWATPQLFGNDNPNQTHQTDLSLHSQDATERFPLLMGILYPLEWERTFEGPGVCAFCRRWWWVSYIAASMYLVGLYLGTNSMKDKQPYNLKTSLALWNLFLAVFSFVGAVRTAPHLLAMLSNYGFSYTVCRSATASYGSGAVGFWVALFIFSKYAELLDTVLLVVRKRKVGFLHWYHHCSVLLYCWHSYVWEQPTGIYFVAMNYSVHAVMYFYYFLAAVGKPPQWALFVTIMQLVQMAIGILITLSHVHILVYETVPNCDGHIPNLSAALGMYASYFILFAQFLAKRYCGKRENGDGKKSKTM